MDIVLFDDVKELFISAFRRNSLIPMIGSGFTRKCRAKNGVVPSGDDYQVYMANEIKKANSSFTVKKLLKMPFSRVAEFYNDVVDIENIRNYLWDNFTDVHIEKYKKDFLSLDWPYVYTLNIDDGIERGSRYREVIYSNRKVNNEIFDKTKCVIKLHGDVKEIINYDDSISQVFSQTQYIQSLHDNSSLLSRLQHDILNNSIVYVGCSLKDEIDISSVSNKKKSDVEKPNVFFCTTSRPKYEDEYQLGLMGVTHCVIFESYEDIYHKIYECGLEAKKIAPDSLDCYKKVQVNTIDNSDFAVNKPYLFEGKSLLSRSESSCSITFPYFYVKRSKISKSIIDKMENEPLIFAFGSGCSGRSYFLADIASRVAKKDVYLFETKERLHDVAFNNLINKKKSVFLFDSNVLTSEQVYLLLGSKEKIASNLSNAVIMVDKKDNEFQNILEAQNYLDDKNTIIIPRKMSKSEIKEINELLAKTRLGQFDEEITLVDNIVQSGQALNITNKYGKLVDELTDHRMLAALISLAIEKKIYSYRAVVLNIYEELILLSKKYSPLIENEVTWEFERSPSDPSPKKYIINAEHWLCSQLEHLASNEKNHKVIIKAYRYLVEQIIKDEGAPELNQGTRDASYKRYTMFDEINRVFNEHGEGQGLSLIRSIYNELNDLLATDPQFLHQRSKCWLKSAILSKKNLSLRKDYLQKAFIDSNTAFRTLELRYKKTGNKNVKRSWDHVLYTQSLILCYQCQLENYADIRLNYKCVEKLFLAFSTENNSYAKVVKDPYNDGVIKRFIMATSVDGNMNDSEGNRKLSQLLLIVQRPSSHN